MVNPYFCYCLSFTTALLMYMLGWSDLYPALSFQLILFLAVTILAHILMSLRLRSTNVGGFAVLKCNTNVAPWIVTTSLYLLWTAEFIYARGVPLFK